MSDKRPVIFDQDNPEWSAEDFARARPISEFPKLAEAFAGAKAKGGRPKGSAKEVVTMRIDKDVLAKLRAGGPGWQTRVNDMLRKAVG